MTDNTDNDLDRRDARERAFEALQWAVLGVPVNPPAHFFEPERLEGAALNVDREGIRRVRGWSGGGKVFNDALADAFRMVGEDAGYSAQPAFHVVSHFRLYLNEVGRGRVVGYEDTRTCGLARAASAALEAALSSSMPVLSYLSENPDEVNRHYGNGGYRSLG